VSKEWQKIIDRQYQRRNWNFPAPWVDPQAAAAREVRLLALEKQRDKMGQTTIYSNQPNNQNDGD